MRLGLSNYLCITSIIISASCAAGNLARASQTEFYVTNATDGAIDAVTADGTVASFASGFVDPRGIAMDGSGNLYVGTQDANDDIYKVSPAGQVTLFAAIDQATTGIAIDSAGNLFVAAPSSREILKVTPDGVSHLFYNATMFPDQVLDPEGVTFDSNGNLLFADFNGGSSSSASIVKVSAGGVGQSVVSNIYLSIGVAAASSGNVYDSSSYNIPIGRGPTGEVYTNGIYEISPAGMVSIFSEGLSEPAGMAFDASGNLFVCNSGANDIIEITPAGNSQTFADIDSPAYIVYVPEPASGPLVAAIVLYVISRLSRPSTIMATE